MNRNKKVVFLVTSAAIAALYVIFSLPVMNFIYGPIQFRVSEALSILPYFTPAAIPGLFVGCFITNMLGSSLPDMIIGSLATLIAATLSYLLRKNKYLVPLPPIIVNALMIGPMLYFLAWSEFSLGWTIAYVALSQTIICYGIGMLLLVTLERNKVFTRLKIS